MSGISGIVNLDGAPVDLDLLRRMTNFLSFRGPDATDIWSAGNVGFGHTMLRTTWEAQTEHQPLSLDGTVWLTADARIDGRRELMATVEGRLQRPLHTVTPNDAELILYSYEAWGEDCVQHLLGDFTFAIWDGRTRRLFCARDQFGVKPFFFVHTVNSFVFSNTLNSLRMDARVSDILNENAIGDYLLFGVNQDLSTTTFRDIHRLPPGHSISISNGTINKRRYWAPTAGKQVHYPNPHDYVERFKELLVAATDDRLRTSHVSVSMSGGLDSTSVAAVASDLLRQQSPSSVLQTYAVVYDRLIPDEERHYSQIAAASLGLPIHHLVADDYSLYDGRDPYDLIQAEPFLLSPLAGQFNDLSRLLAGSGRVALTGWDGDGFMNEPPNAYFASCASHLEIKKLASAMAWFVWSQRRLPPIGFRTQLKRLRGKYPAQRFYPVWVDEAFSKRINLRQRERQLTDQAGTSHSTRPYAFRVLNSTMWASLFEGYDPGATRLLLELRHPLIDLRLIDYLLAIPAVPWCVNKEILRCAMKDKLPPPVLGRAKTPLAGDPVLQIVKGSVRCLDEFDVDPQLKDFVNLKHRRSLADEQTADELWANLRIFGLNHWIRYSLHRRQNDV